MGEDLLDYARSQQKPQGPPCRVINEYGKETRESIQAKID
jgi:hypothetical protein